MGLKWGTRHFTSVFVHWNPSASHSSCQGLVLCLCNKSTKYRHSELVTERKIETNWETNIIKILFVAIKRLLYCTFLQHILFMLSMLASQYCLWDQQQQNKALPVWQGDLNQEGFIVYFLPVGVDGPLDFIIKPGIGHHDDVVHLGNQKIWSQQYNIDVRPAYLILLLLNSCKNKIL